MAEDLTGLTIPSKKLVKSYKVIYTPDPAPAPIYPPEPPPARPTTGNTGGLSGGGTRSSPFGVAKTSNPVQPYKTIKLSAGQTVTISNVTYTAGPKGAWVLYWSDGYVNFVQI